MFAVAAVGAGCDDAFAFREARQEDVEEAAEGEAEQRGEDGSDELELARYFGRLLRLDEDNSTSARTHLFAQSVVSQFEF